MPIVDVWIMNDDAIKWKHFPRNWPFVRGIHRSPVNSPHKGQWGGALMFTLICARINGWVNTREAGDLRRYRPHYDVIVMASGSLFVVYCCGLLSDFIGPGLFIRLSQFQWRNHGNGKDNSNYNLNFLRTSYKLTKQALGHSETTCFFIISYHIVSYRITSHHITSLHITAQNSTTQHSISI